MDKKIEENTTEPLVHDFNKENLRSAFTPKVLALLVFVVVLGIGAGFVISSKTGPASVKTSTVATAGSSEKGTVVGSNDTTAFKDTAEGTLKEGGINGEGAFHLVRPGGDSQNVYLTSSSVDLSKFINQKIKVWGATQKAQYAGWLMDVGRIEVL